MRSLDDLVNRKNIFLIEHLLERDILTEHENNVELLRYYSKEKARISFLRRRYKDEFKHIYTYEELQ